MKRALKSIDYERRICKNRSLASRRGSLRPFADALFRVALRAGQRRDGRRANFEERYSGETLQGNYIGGVYYPDKTRVGWWKNGYPEYFAKVPNAAFWIGVDVAVDGEPLDLATVAEVKSFYRETDMRRSVLTRRMRVVLKNGVEVAVETVRFLSLARANWAS